jgi:hypothetical protein
MVASTLAAGFALTVVAFQAPVPGANAPGSAADVITLRDGAKLLGQVSRVGRQGELGVLARRAWVEARLPAQAKVWERDEAERVRQAKLQRRDRLFAWRDDRARGGGSDSLIDRWINREFGNVADPRPPRTVLMEVVLDRPDVRAVEKRDEETARLLRLGWLAGLGGVETMSVPELRAALVFRGALREGDPGLVERLLPLRPESDARWRLRRAATEAVAEPDLRFVRFRWFILPESGPEPDVAPPEDRTELLDSQSALEIFRSIQAVKPADPVQLRLNEIAERGRIGAIASQVEFSDGLDAADAESALGVRQENGVWTAPLSREATARVDDPPDPEAPIAAATPIRTALLVLELVAATPPSPDVTRRRQAAGAAAQRALGRARVALDRDLAPLVLPIFEQGRP